MSQSRGEAFEDRVFRLIREELDRERLGLLPHACAIFRRKGYRSRDRGTDIVVDVSVEMVLPNAPTWSLLWAWECKDYKGPVGVEDVEEFWAKLQQIAGANVKGGLASSAALRRGALRYAKSKGLAVVRVLPDDHIDWLLHMEGTASLERLHSEKDVVYGHRILHGIRCNDYIVKNFTPCLTGKQPKASADGGAFPFLSAPTAYGESSEPAHPTDPRVSGLWS